jgi:hypothetical protein
VILSLTAAAGVLVSRGVHGTDAHRTEAPDQQAYSTHQG